VSNTLSYHRIFIAIPIDNELKHYIHQTARAIYPNYPALRWINQENYHITLHYLGSLSHTQLETVSYKIQPIIEHYSSFSLKFETTSSFPSARNPHSLVVLTKLSFLLNNLFEETKAAITACGITLSSRVYTPHITLARIKTGAWIGNNKRLPSPLKIPVQELQLLQSLTEEETVKFKKLSAFKLTHHAIEV